MSLSGGDRRPARLSGLDRRVARLLGGDRLAPTPALISGSAALAALAGAGLSSAGLSAASSAELEALLAAGAGGTELGAAGAVSLAQVLAAGGSSVALDAPGSGALASLLGAGSCTVDLPPSGGASLSSLAASGGASVFRPSDVPEVAAGFYWDPAEATNSDVASFAMPEGNGKSAYDMVTPSLGTAPVIGTVNGCTVIQYTNRTSPAIDDLARTNAKVTRGWTGALYLWGWFLTPPGGCGLVLSQWRTALNFGLQLNPSDVRIQANDGSIKEHRYAVPAGGYAAGPVFYEALVVPLEPTPTNRLQLFYNRVQQTPTISVSFGTTVLDTSEFLTFSGAVSDGSGFNIVGDFSHGVAGISPAVPSDADRDRLFQYRRLAP